MNGDTGLHHLDNSGLWRNHRPHACHRSRHRPPTNVHPVSHTPAMALTQSHTQQSFYRHSHTHNSHSIDTVTHTTVILSTQSHTQQSFYRHSHTHNSHSIDTVTHTTVILSTQSHTQQSFYRHSHTHNSHSIDTVTHTTVILSTQSHTPAMVWTPSHIHQLWQRHPHTHQPWYGHPHTHQPWHRQPHTNTYKTVTRPILEYAGTIYAPIISDKQLTALQVTQNQGLRIATGCTSYTNINHIHDKTKILPIEKHLRLHSSQLRQKASHPDHPLHRLTTQPQPPRLKRKTIFNNNQYTLNIDPDPTHAIDENTIKRNMKTIHTTIVQDHLNNRPINKLLNRPPPDIDKTEETLPHSTRRKLSQLRTNKSPLLMTYLHKIDPANHPAANCPLCNDPNHDSLHLFNCPDIPTTLTVWDL